MAFQMIPPRLSSSPPPLDSLPTVTCPGEEEDDEEFGSFSTHNASFDITGLSDKLPPTPESSPSKFPALSRVTGKILPAVIEGTREDTISQDSGLGSSNHPNEFSPQPQVDDHSFGEFSGCDQNRVSSDSSDAVARNDNGDCGFADSQSCSTSDDPQRSQEPESTTLSLANSNIDEADENSSQAPGNSSKRSARNSFSMIGTPPPLDYVANNVIQGDELTYNSSNLTADSDDDFGDFASSKVAEVGCSSPDGDNERAPLPNDKENGTLQGSRNDEGSQLCSVKGADIFHLARKPKKTDESSDFGNQDAMHKSVEAVGVDTESGSSCTSICDRFNSHVKKTDEDVIPNSENELLDDKRSKTCIESQRTSLQTEISTRAENIDEDYGDFSSVSVSEKINNSHEAVSNFDDMQENTDVNLKTKAREHSKINKGINDKWKDCESIGDSGESEGEKDSKECTGSESCVSACNYVDISDARGDERTAKGEDDCDKLYMVVKEQHGNSDGRDLSKADSLDESDFGDFSKADDDDLDFADLRKQVESGDFGKEESVHPAHKDFGDFSESDTNAEDLEDQFGDFKAPMTTVIDSEFGDFDDANNNESDNEFGDFAAPDSVPQNLTCSQYSNDDDEFGDFNDTSAGDIGNSSLASGERVPGIGDFTSWNESSTEPTSKTRPVLRKLESLVLKWIPKATTAAGLQEEQSIPTLRQAVESDAFVWKQLENLESSAALTLSWGNTQAHNFFLSSVNVDARNILFGQKWSSSVPLFAQTLSFSPLTPAKPKEGNGGPAGGFNGCNGEPTSPPVTAIPPPLKDETPVEVAPAKDGTSEEQIPPAKFDWTSSGLTNPLEGPAYNSSLFGLDLLLTNTSIGKGATNALLASLEREFLSENGEKSTSSRIKSPPTPSPLVQQILGGGMTKSSLTTTPLHSLNPEVREIVEHLPDLSFMHSKVLMFPIKGEQ